MNLLDPKDLNQAKQYLNISQQDLDFKLLPERFLALLNEPETSRLIGTTPHSQRTQCFYQHYYIAPMALSSDNISDTDTDAYPEFKNALNGASFFVRTPPMIVVILVNTERPAIYYDNFKFYPIPKLTADIGNRYINEGVLPTRDGSLLSNNVYGNGSFCFGELDMLDIISPNNLIQDGLPNTEGVRELIGNFFLGSPNNDLGWYDQRLVSTIFETLAIAQPESISNLYRDTKSKYAFWLYQKAYADAVGFDISTVEGAAQLDIFWEKLLTRLLAL